jgi:integrase
MGYTKDLWSRPDPDGNGRVHNSRWGHGKRWLACWIDPDGTEKSRAFRTQTAATVHWKAMEADKDRGDYHNPDAGKVLFGVFGKRWLDSRIVDPASMIRYEASYRLHVAPVFAHHEVRAIRPSRIQGWIRDLSERFGPSTVITAFLVLQGILDLALADEAIRKNAAKSPVVQVPVHQAADIEVWDDAVIVALADAHPSQLRAIPELAASLGMREGELFGLAEEDIDLDGEKVVRVRRQFKAIGRAFVFALPKNDRERIIPLSDWDIAVIRQHIDRYPPRPYTLPWEKPGGKPHTCKLLFRWPSDDQHVKARSYSETVWKPAAAKAGVIPAPQKDKRGRARYATTRKEGIHQLRHYYASVMLAGGVSIKEVAEYLGHADPAFTLRVYAHLLPSSHDRARAVINERFTNMNADPGSLTLKRQGAESAERADGTETEQATSEAASP